MKKLEMHWKIGIGIILGVLVGVLLIQFHWGNQFITDWIKPFGTIFINLLKLIAIPLIVVSLIKGITDLKDITQLSKMGFKTFGIYILTTVIAVAVGLVLVNSLKPGGFISEQTRTEMLSSFGDDIDKKIGEVSTAKELGPLQALVDIVPENLMYSASNNSNMLQIIFFTILFGVSMVLLPEGKTTELKKVLTDKLSAGQTADGNPNANPSTRGNTTASPSGTASGIGSGARSAPP